jgi:hypothetical protein
MSLIARAEAKEQTVDLAYTLVNQHMQRQRQTQQQQQQQKQQQKQLPPDQQAELDNSLNALSLAVLKFWPHIVRASVVQHEDVESCAVVGEWGYSLQTPTRVVHQYLAANILAAWGVRNSKLAAL